MGIWILNAQTVASGNELAKRHILVEGQLIEQIIEAGDTLPDTAGHEVIDAAGKLVTAGLIDMHVHLQSQALNIKRRLRVEHAQLLVGALQR